MKCVRLCFISVIAAALSLVAEATDLTVLTARKAAKNFIEKDGVGSSLLIGCSVKDVTARDGLWVVTLKPSGYILLSGNTAAEPVVAFSRNDFMEPEAGSAFAEMIESAEANAAVAKANAAVESVSSGLMSVSLASAADSSLGVSERREAKWKMLLGTSSSIISSLFNGGISTASITYDEASLTKSVLPFMETEWSQWQPYNDYVPIALDAMHEVYRNRYPCGCVATAYAQVLKYWEWPALMDEVFECTHTVYASAGTVTKKVRFDGHEAFDWSSMSNSYPYYLSAGNTYDMRGVTSERARYEVARLISMSAVMAGMYYSTGGSGANVSRMAGKNPWYEVGTTLVRGTVNNDTTFFAAVKSSLEEGAPVFVAVTNHQVVAHGWAEGSDGTGYVYLNYGWGDGYNDGYFNITETDQTDTSKGYVLGVVVGHRPRRTVQIEALPAVSEESVTLKWHVPERYAANFTGYEIVVGHEGTTASSWSYGFEDTSVNYGGFTVGKISGIGNNTSVISVIPGKGGNYEFPKTFKLTGQSVLSYRLRSVYAYGLTLKVQGSFDGGEWVDVDVPTVSTSYTTSWSTRQVSLGEKVGQTLRLRVVVTTTGTYLTSGSSNACGIQLDDFALAQVLPFEEETVACETSARSHTFTGLTPGAAYSFAVKPVGDETVLSSAVQTTIVDQEAGRGAAALPRIRSVTSVSGSSLVVQEGFFRECARGTNVFFVSCSAGVTNLVAHPSHQYLLTEEDATVLALGRGKFAVTLDASGIGDEDDRTRMILTLEAEDESGRKAYKDLSLRFSSESAAETYTPGLADYLTSTPIPVPYQWLVEKRLATSEDMESAKAMDAAAAADSDGDGCVNWVEYLCGTDPTDADDCFKALIEMVEGKPVISWNKEIPNAEYSVIGADSPTSTNWTTVDDQTDMTTMRFFRVKATVKED